MSLSLLGLCRFEGSHVLALLTFQEIVAVNSEDQIDQYVHLPVLFALEVSGLKLFVKAVK